MVALVHVASISDETLRDQTCLLFAALCTFSWGIWGLLVGIAERNIHPVHAFECHCVGYGFAYLVAAAISRSPLIWDLETVVLSASGGFGYGVGTLLLIAAVRSGYPTGLAVVLTSMYPLGVFTLNSFVKGVAMFAWQLAGLAVGVLAICLIAEPWVQQDEEVATWTGFVLCALAFVGFVGWSFLMEGVDEDMIILSGLWQALGCSIVCVFARPIRLFTSSKGEQSLQATNQLPYGSVESSISLETHTATGRLAGFGMGLAMASGAGFFILASSRTEKLNPIVLITSMYGAVTLILCALVFGESLTLSKYMGVILALIACSLVSF